MFGSSSQESCRSQQKVDFRDGGKGSWYPSETTGAARPQRGTVPDHPCAQDTGQGHTQRRVGPGLRTRSLPGNPPAPERGEGLFWGEQTDTTGWF